VDHETALEAANQALSGSNRSTERIAALELSGVDGSRRSGRALPSLDARSPLMNEAWQVAATIGVAVATLVLVVVLWLM
jgi:hypothetical protein